MKLKSLNLAGVNILLCLTSVPCQANPIGAPETAVQQKRNIVESFAAGTVWFNPHVVYNQSFARQGKRAPEKVRAAAEKAAEAIIHNEKVKRGTKMNIQTVAGFQDTEYLVPVTIGSQKMNVELDTSDTQTWVFSTLLPKEERGKHVLYNPGSKKPLGDFTSFYHSEEDSRGYAWGVPYADKVVIGPYTATSAHVGAATVMAPALIPKKSDGSIGMALDRPYCEGTCDSFLQSKPFNAGSYLQQFGLDIKASGQSTWELGSYDSKTYPFAKQSWANVIVSIPENPWINDEGKWMLEGGACFINKKKDKNTNCGHEVIVSTSSPMIILPSQIVNYYYSKVSGASYDDETGTWYFPCSSTLPSFGFDFDPINHPEGTHTPGKYINLGPLNDDTGRCFGALQQSFTAEYNVLGTAFLKSQYVAFEVYLERGVPSGGVVMFSPKAV